MFGLSIDAASHSALYIIIPLQRNAFILVVLGMCLIFVSWRATLCTWRSRWWLCRLFCSEIHLPALHLEHNVFSLLLLSYMRLNTGLIMSFWSNPSNLQEILSISCETFETTSQPSLYWPDTGQTSHPARSRFFFVPLMPLYALACYFQRVCFHQFLSSVYTAVLL